MFEQDRERPILEAIMAKKGLIAGGAAIAILVSAAAWWLAKPSYAVLLSDLPEQNRADVMALLMDARVPYRVDEASGSVSVPADELASLRAQMSEKGLLAKQGAGLELFGQGDYGMSEFAQGINYQRALQGELERTIRSIEEVRQARVHITLGKNSIFESRREPAKASVALQLRSGKQIAQSQVKGIRLLVAAAVPSLSADQVVVLDEMGRSLAADEQTGDQGRWASVRELEQDYESRARALVAGVMPEAKLRISVKLSVNFDKKRSVRENVVPVGESQSGYLAKRREQTSSNQTNTAEGAATGNQSSNNTESEYLFGREHDEVEHAPGRIERVSVGIVASEIVPGPKADVIREVLFSGLGMDVDRGDSLAITGVVGSYRVADASVKPGVGKASASTPAAAERSWWTPIRAIVLFGLAAFAVVMTFAYRRLQRQVATQRLLTADERERLLGDVRQWLGADSSVTKHA